MKLFVEGVGYLWTGVLWSIGKLTPLAIAFLLFIVWM